jgi:hypothetical protein
MNGSDEDRAPICPYCGVTTLPDESARAVDVRFVCENPDCEVFGEVVKNDEPGLT